MVEKRRWTRGAHFLHALNFSMLLIIVLQFVGFVGVILNLGVKFTQDALWPQNAPKDLVVAALALAAFGLAKHFLLG